MLIKCPECGREISDKADNCPNCGYPISKAKMQLPVNQIPRPQVNAMNAIPQKPKMSGLGIAALILCVLGCTFWIGIILAVVDLCKKDGKKKTCSIVAVVISLFWIFAVFASSGSSDKKAKVSQSIETEEAIEQESNENEIKEEIIEHESEESEISSETTLSYESREDFVGECVAFDYKTIARNPDEYVGAKVKLTVDIFEVCSGGIFDKYDRYYKTFDDDMNMIWVFDQQNDDDKIKLLDGDNVTVYGVFTGMVETKNHLTGAKGEEVGIELKYADLVE